jgi:hypothetical protein
MPPRRRLAVVFGTTTAAAGAEIPTVVVDRAERVIGGSVNRVQGLHRLLFKHAERPLAVHFASLLEKKIECNNYYLHHI